MDTTVKFAVKLIMAILMISSLNVFSNCVVAEQSPFDPIQDDPSLPRVLLIGDSISIGYTVPVQQLLSGKANVHRIPVNGEYTQYGLDNIKEWLGDGKWDVIHFNWGIWDTHLLDSNGGLIPSKDEEGKNGTIRTSIAQYQQNLNRLIDIMESTGAKLIWATSTPVMSRKGDRLKDIDRYNKAAAEVMNLRRVSIDDLSAQIKPHLKEMQLSDAAHFTPEGYEFLGKQVAKSILTALPARREQSLNWSPDKVSEETIEGRRVLRFEYDCRKEWGYTEKIRQYFYVVEPKIKGNGPLLVCLHSAGSNPDKFENGKLEMPANVTRIAQAGDDFTGLILNSGTGTEWWWGEEEIKANPDKYKQSLTPVENRILATVEWATQKYNIDRNRIYLRGISMGGSGTLGIGMSHGDVFAALLAGVPAGTNHAVYRLTNAEQSKDGAAIAHNIPPVFVFFSQKDDWSKEMEGWLNLVHQDKLSVLAAWGPWGHVSNYDMTNPAAFEFPWLSIRKNEAYPAFASTSSDEKYPGFKSDDVDQNGQMNAYFRWSVLSDQPARFAIELRLVQNGELDGKVGIPSEATTDVTLRRLQHFDVKAGKAYNWRIEQGGKLISSGKVTADGKALLTISGVKIAAKPIMLEIDQ